MRRRSPTGTRHLTLSRRNHVHVFNAKPAETEDHQERHQTSRCHTAITTTFFNAKPAKPAETEEPPRKAPDLTLSHCNHVTFSTQSPQSPQRQKTTTKDTTPHTLTLQSRPRFSTQSPQSSQRRKPATEDTKTRKTFTRPSSFFVFFVGLRVFVVPFNERESTRTCCPCAVG
jgi:hypothetical protein